MSGIIGNMLLGLEGVKKVDFATWSITNRDLWDSLPEDIRKEVITHGEESTFTKDDYIDLSLWRDFKKTGNRSRFEAVYFAKRRKLSALAVAECVENKGRFVSAIEEGIWALLGEPAWVIPAHNSYVRDTEQLTAPLLERPVLDLFACETAEILALTAACLGPVLDPILVDDIHFALDERITKPYINDSFWWMGGEGPLINWSPWCTQNVLIAVLSNPRTDEKTARKALRQATLTLDAFMDSYGDDGGCDEGASYYHAAALALFGALMVMETASGRDFAPLYANAKLRAMAGYIHDVFVAEDIYLNYADCSPKAGTLTAREYLFAKATGNDAMAHHAAIDVMKYGWQESDNNYNLYYKLIALSSYNEVKAEAEKAVSYIPNPFKLFDKTQLAIYRQDDVTFAIKGGSNGESHNHNDVGSIILYRGTRPLLVDIGVETYTKTTFSPQRYTLKPMQSLYHNVVNFPPLQQKDGLDYRTGECSFSANSAVLDLTPAYSADGTLSLYRRTASIDRERLEITVREETRSTGTPVLTLMTLEEPKVDGRVLDCESFTITFDRDVETEVEVFPVTDARLRKAWPEKLYRTLVTFKDDLDWTITFKENEK